MSTLDVVSQAAGVANVAVTAVQLFTVAFKPYRAIKVYPDNAPTVEIIANATIEERHNDELTITEHPVEQGAAITDHAYKNPAIVSLRLAWSNSDPSGGYDPFYVTRVYEQLLALQESRVLFSLFTGKRNYNNMLIQSIAVTTDAASEQTLFATLVCRQVIIVEAVATPVSSDQSLQADPGNTSPTIDSGSHQLTTAPFFDEGAALSDGVPL